MRILYFSKFYTTHDRQFLSKLTESHHEIWYLPLRKNHPLSSTSALPKGIHSISWPSQLQTGNKPDDLLDLMPAFESILKQVNPDVIHAGPIQPCGFMAAVADTRPLILMSWAYDILVEAEQNETLRWMTQYALNRSDKLVCDCEAVKLKAKQLASMDDESIIQFPWGVDLILFCPGTDSLQLREQLGWEKEFVIISTRSWEPIYGISVLLESFQTAYAQNPHLRLALLGNGALAGSVRQQIESHGISNVVHCPGVVSREQLPNYFRSANLYMSCALSDGTSVSLLEAMATGLPVLVSDVPGNREWIEPGINGWLEPTNDANAFSGSILAASEMSHQERANIGLTNRNVVEQRADWSVNSKELLQMYLEVEAQLTG